MKNNLIILIISGLFLVSCVASKNKHTEYPEIYKEKPKSILVLPPANNSTAADSKDLLRTTILPALAEKGYYVLPIEPIFDFLKLNGAYSIAESSQDLPLDKFSSVFNADAVLKITINKWDKNYYVTGGDVEVDLIYELISIRTGKTLWKKLNGLKVDTSGVDTGSILGNLVATAVSTATTKYITVAKKVHLQALSDLPAGFHSKRYQLDKNDIVK